MLVGAKNTKQKDPKTHTYSKFGKERQPRHILQQQQGRSILRTSSCKEQSSTLYRSTNSLSPSDVTLRCKISDNQNSHNAGHSYKVETYESTNENKAYKVSEGDEEHKLEDDCNIEEMSNEDDSEHYDQVYRLQLNMDLYTMKKTTTNGRHGRVGLSSNVSSFAIQRSPK